MEDTQEIEIQVGGAWMNSRTQGIYAVVTRVTRSNVSFTAIYGPGEASTYTVPQKYFRNHYKPIPTD